MTTAPTAEEFLAQYDPEDDFEGPTPLDSIADSLSVIAGVLSTQQIVGLVGDHVEETETPDTRLQEAFDDLEDKHRSLFELLAAIEKIVKPSTSKVSLDVKAAIEAWKSPEVPAEQVAVEEPEPLAPPAHDADVEEWRAYARSVAVYTPGEALPDIDGMNRSQIRTMLGIEQPDPAAP